MGDVPFGQKSVHRAKSCSCLLVTAGSEARSGVECPAPGQKTSARAVAGGQL